MKKSSRPVAARPAELALDLGPEPSAQPLFVRIARAISDDIQRGRLPEGTRLPGSRALAARLQVHRNTVLAALRELHAQGWIETHAARGTFVSATLPDAAPRGFGARTGHARAPGRRAGFTVEAVANPDAQPLPLPAHTLRMFGGLPDLRLVPSAAFVRAYRRALRNPSAVLGYGFAQGHPRLRAALASVLNQARGLVVEAEDVLITRGSQMALALTAQALLRPSDAVAVEAYGYQPAWRALRAAGAQLVPVPVDAHGLCVDALDALARRQQLRAVYLTPHHQYPTTATLSPGRRLSLLALARRHRFAIIEDDYDHEFHYEGRPLLPLASADRAGVVVYIGTLSKVLAPGFRIGYAVAPRDLLRAMVARRYDLDRQGDLSTECAIAELIEDGELQRHLRRTRRIYRARRDACARALTRSFGDRLAFRVPQGGMALWVHAQPPLNVERWLARALVEGVAFQSGGQFTWEGKPVPFARIGYAALDEAEIALAVKRLLRAADSP